jgi:hypothetical protein
VSYGRKQTHTHTILSLSRQQPDVAKENRTEQAVVPHDLSQESHKLPTAEDFSTIFISFTSLTTQETSVITRSNNSSER